MSVKQAVLADLDVLVPLFEAYRKFYGKQSDVVGSTHFLKARLEHQQSVIFLVKWENIPVGFVQLYPLFSSTRLQSLWLLNDLYVAEDCRQKGLGMALIQKAQEWCVATQAAGLLLETEKNNVPGNQLYPKMGFDIDREHHFYFWDNKSVD